MDVVLLTRGHGFGHAARDLLLIDGIRATRPGVRLTVASSGTGTEFYRLNNVPCHDLDIPDHLDTTEHAGRAVLRYLTSIPRPDFVIVDEVVFAMHVCRKVLGVDTVFLTEWFYAELGMPHLDHTLNHTSAIVVPDFPEAHGELSAITVPTHFPGPLVRTHPHDRAAARAELGLPEDVFLAVVSLGGMPEREFAQHAIDAVALAWQAGATGRDRLVIRAEPRTETQRAAGARWVGLSQAPPRLFAAADVVVVDGAGFTACELAKTGIPVLAFRAPWMNTASLARLDVLESAGLVATAGTDIEPDVLWQRLRGQRLLGQRLRAARPGVADGLRWADPVDVAGTVLAYAG